MKQPIQNTTKMKLKISNVDFNYEFLTYNEKNEPVKEPGSSVHALIQKCANYTENTFSRVPLRYTAALKSYVEAYLCILSKPYVMQRGEWGRRKIHVEGTLRCAQVKCLS